MKSERRLSIKAIEDNEIMGIWFHSDIKSISFVFSHIKKEKKGREKDLKK
ncbi:MAG: hypothetical protein NT038_10300 [Euryarchaeota archaeon]|nr:hypothetical protein [Euryarchaeota archaeon]